MKVVESRKAFQRSLNSFMTSKMSSEYLRMFCLPYLPTMLVILNYPFPTTSFLNALIQCFYTLPYYSILHYS